MMKLHYMEKVAFFHNKGEKGTNQVDLDCSVKQFKENCKVNNAVLDCIVTIYVSIKGVKYNAVLYNKRKGYCKQDYIDNL